MASATGMDPVVDGNGVARRIYGEALEERDQHVETYAGEPRLAGCLELTVG
jgi:hypothetical protein